MHGICRRYVLPFFYLKNIGGTNFTDRRVLTGDSIGQANQSHFKEYKSTKTDSVHQKSMQVSNIMHMYFPQQQKCKGCTPLH